MKLLVNDFARYSFVAQLSRELAARNHDVRHVYCSTQTTTPEGSIAPRTSDPANLQIQPIALKSNLNKYAFLRRRKQEIEYGRKAGKILEEYRPTMVISANTPLDSQLKLWQSAQRVGAKKIFWMQDVISVAIKKILVRKLPIAGRLIAHHYHNIERKLLLTSDAIVVIAPTFRDLLVKWGLPAERIHLIPNWAPLEEIPQQPKDNPWSKSRSLSSRFLFLYSGTLSLKHNPELLLHLARAVERMGALVIVRSQGQGAEWLKRSLTSTPQNNLIVEGYGPYSELPYSLSAADVLVVLLEHDASEFSVPSKTLSYMCAGRAILAAVPHANLISEYVKRSNAGLVVDPLNVNGLCEAAISLVNHPQINMFGTNARRTAEQDFDIAKIANQFENLIHEI